MHCIRSPIAFLLVVSVGLVSAQDATPSQSLAPSASSGGLCASQEVVDTCVTVMQGSLSKCTDNDWDCKCSGSANIANCYEDCPDDPARFSAIFMSEQDCATANAYDKGISSVATTWTTPGPNTVTATPTDVEVSTTTNTAGPTKLTALEDASPSKGAAAMKSAGSLLALLGLGVGVMI
ncbi:hypothetical protein N7466_003536 [Penicillium verhagenii]|uniref:uncharacterized protein n=1 Tax=Penicillium verhagenii TaxID=1562060 RepID=UPI002545239B|nr:uncharacterized protein N7466_003536 [Penicillium verhagenii]KAJ5937086.1 hypothetical protein N7466_003536 [Penicillium verhagenii]